MKLHFSSGDLSLLEKTFPSVPRGTWEGIMGYANLVQTWNEKMNLTGARSPQKFFNDHIGDCLLAWQAIGERKAWLDVGSGAGLPGIIWAAVCPNSHFILVEPLKKRSAFLERAKAELELNNVNILANRLEALHATDLAELGKNFSIVSRGTFPPQALLTTAAALPLPWAEWVIFSNLKIHQEYLDLSGAFEVEVASVDYPRSLAHPLDLSGKLTILRHY